MTRTMNYRTMQVCGTSLFLRAQFGIGLHHGLPVQMGAAPGGDHCLSSTSYPGAISKRPKIRPGHPA